MITENDHITIETLPLESEYSSFGYTQILKKYNLSFEEKGKFLKANQRPRIEGWVLYISVVVTEVKALLDRIVPYLAKENLSFDVAKSPAVVKALFAGFYGYEMIGKIIVVYPEQRNISRLTSTMIELTDGFRGPILPTAFHLKGVVYTNLAEGDTDKIESTDIKEPKLNNRNAAIVARQFTWPFLSITPPRNNKEKKILAKRFVIEQILKNDAKGRVMKVLDLRTLRYRVIKEGIKYMSYDYAGRDVTDRLRWQFEIHNTLFRIIPAPEAFDLFEESGNFYLVIGFKHGIPFSQFIDESYVFHHCSTLQSDTWEKIINGLKSILTLLHKIHSAGYIFRDVNPRNFLIDKSGNIVCIDFELTYNINTGKPSPPFELGTIGYMSPEQNVGAIPTVQQDIYGVGGLMVRCLTGLSPMVFNLDDIDALQNQLNFHMGSEQANLISLCFSPVPEHRPPLSRIIAALETWPNNYFNPRLFKMGKPDIDQVKSVIQNAIRGLASTKLMNQEKLWVSKQNDTFGNLPNEVTETIITPDLYQGIGGIIYLLMEAKMSGFDLSPCKDILELNFNYVFNHYVNGAQIVNPGLFHGMAGNALLALKAISLEWMTPTPEIIRAIRRSVEQQMQYLCLASGAAGIGIILIEQCKISQEEWPRKALEGIICQLLEKQCKDGSWDLSVLNASESKNIDIGLFSGVTGIVYFLLRAYQYSQNSAALSGAMRGLNYLIKNERRFNKHINGPWVESGIAGVSISFLLGFSATQETNLRRHAEKLLRGITPRLNAAHLGFSDGIAGVGEVYLNAARILDSQEWIERADWLTSYILHRAIHEPGGGLLWVTDTSGVLTGSLMTGNCAIIHYLLGYLTPDKTTYPIF